MNEFDNKTWKQAFAEVNAMHLKALKKQKELKELLNKTK